MGDPLSAYQGFVQARQVAAMMMRSALESDGLTDHLGAPWLETTITDVYRAGLGDAVRTVKFTQVQEATTGADLLIWFVERDSNEAFGTLAQAKNLRRTPAGWFDVDFDYSDGAQLRALLDASDILQVPAIYLIYAGPSSYRDELEGCEDFGDEYAVSALPALLTAGIRTMAEFHGDDVGGKALEQATPMETAVVGQPGPMFILGATDSDLREFAGSPQNGPRSIAKEVLRRMADRRSAELSQAPTLTEPTPIFSNVPVDTGHSFMRPYVPHVLRGLVRGQPRYVSSAVDLIEPGTSNVTSSLSDLDGPNVPSVRELWVIDVTSP